MVPPLVDLHIFLICLVDVTLRVCDWGEEGGHIWEEAKIDHRHHCRLSKLAPPALSLFLFSLRSDNLFVSSVVRLEVWLSLLKNTISSIHRFPHQYLSNTSPFPVFVTSQKSLLKATSKKSGKRIWLFLWNVCCVVWHQASVYPCPDNLNLNISFHEL